MKIYFASNFEMMNVPKNEKRFARFLKKEFGCYRRLASFFFAEETKRLINTVKEMESEDSDGSI